MRATQHRNRLQLRLAAILALCLGLLALAGCGGSSSPQRPASVTVQKARPTPGLNDPDGPGAQEHQAADAKSGRRHNAGHAKGSAESTAQAAGGSDESSAAPTSQEGAASHAAKKESGAAGTVLAAGSQLNPCTLVSVAAAQSITGGLIQDRVEAPLGPTCIYRLSNTHSSITLAVESQKLSQIAHHMTQRRQLDIGGRRAFCGKLGTQMIFVPLASGRILNVTAPCSIAQRFAQLALSRLAA